MPDYEAVNWWGIVAPAGTPAADRRRLHKAIEAGAGIRPKLQKQFATEGAEVVKMTTPRVRRLMVRK